MVSGGGCNEREEDGETSRGRGERSEREGEGGREADRQRQRTKTFPEQRGWEIYRCVSWTRIAEEESGSVTYPPYIRGRAYSRKYR